MISLDHYKVLTYYGYTTYQQEVIAEYEEYGDTKRGDVRVKWFVEHLVKKMEDEFKERFWDNKIAFKLQHVETGTIIYVGFKDGFYRISLMCSQRFGREYNFEKREWSDYKPEETV